MVGTVVVNNFMVSNLVVRSFMVRVCMMNRHNMMRGGRLCSLVLRRKHMLHRVVMNRSA